MINLLATLAYGMLHFLNIGRVNSAGKSLQILRLFIGAGNHCLNKFKEFQMLVITQLNKRLLNTYRYFVCLHLLKD